MEDNYYWLSILIEQDLYKKIRTIKEGKFSNEKEIIEETVELFIDTLPEYLKRLPNINLCIKNKLNEINKNNCENKKIKDNEENER